MVRTKNGRCYRALHVFQAFHTSFSSVSDKYLRLLAAISNERTGNQICFARLDEEQDEEKKQNNFLSVSLWGLAQEWVS